MKLTTTTNVSVDGVMQGLGGPDEDRRGGFERGGWAMALFDNEAATFVNQIYGRADAFLFGRELAATREQGELAMGKDLMEITMSLDGYVTGPDVSPNEPMGRGGEALHEWMFAGKSAADIEAFQTTLFSGVGAVIMGRRMVDLAIGPWGEEPPYHAPCFVVTHRPAETIVKKGGTSYIFVTGGIEAAMAQAKAAAGEQDAMVNGGADIDRQYLNAGLIDEIRLQLAPIVLGGGTPLFAGVRPDLWLVPIRATSSPLATRLTYQVDTSAVRPRARDREGSCTQRRTAGPCAPWATRSRHYGVSSAPARRRSA